MADHDLELISRVIAREPAACRAFVDKLTPVIQARVNIALLRHRRVNRQDVLDLTQEVFKALLEDDAKALRVWNPERGTSLATWVALIADRRAVSILISGRKSGAREDPQEIVELAGDDRGPTPELHAISRDMLERILDALRERLSNQGYLLFTLLFVEEREVEVIRAMTGLSRDAVYTWKTRILRLVRAISSELMSDVESSPRIQKGGHR